MSRSLLVVAVLIVQSSPAAAEAPPAAAEAPAAPVEKPPGAAASSRIPAIAVGVNSPSSWYYGTISASVYVAINQNQAIRANFARMDRSAWPLALFDDPGGMIYDVGVGWVVYPRRLWDGFMIEAGVLRRQRDTVNWPEMEGRTSTDTTTYSGRALVGWSWRLGRHAFVAAAVGAALGTEHGRETFEDTEAFPQPPAETRSVDRMRADFESYLRFGMVFGG